MYFDSHVHTKASPDSNMNPEEAISILKDKGLGVTFTEHLEFRTPKPGRNEDAPDIPQLGISPLGGMDDFSCDLDRYPSEYDNLRSDTVLMGLEVDLTAAYLTINQGIVANGNFDFIIGSIHAVNGRDMYDDYRNVDVISRYLNYAADMVKLCGFFDSFGHIDFIARYMSGLDEHVTYHRYQKEFDRLLTALAAQGAAIEINTSRLSKKSVLKNLYEIYKQFVRLGGIYCTIGSDAHEPHNLARNFDEGIQLAKDAGMIPVFYKKRERFKCQF